MSTFYGIKKNKGGQKLWLNKAGYYESYEDKLPAVAYWLFGDGEKEVIVEAVNDIDDDSADDDLVDTCLDRCFEKFGGNEELLDECLDKCLEEAGEVYIDKVKVPEDFSVPDMEIVYPDGKTFFIPADRVVDGHSFFLLALFESLGFLFAPAFSEIDEAVSDIPHSDGPVLVKVAGD